MELGQLSIVLILLGQFSGILAQRCWRGCPDYLCPSAPSALEVYLRHETYCSRFYKCIQGEAMEGICPIKEYFDPISNTCVPDESLCLRLGPRSTPDVPGCQFCEEIFLPREPADQFFLCHYDGSGRAERCPRAFDLCTKTNVSLTFVNGRCEPERTVVAPFRIAAAVRAIDVAPLEASFDEVVTTTELSTESASATTPELDETSSVISTESVTDIFSEDISTDSTSLVATTETTEEPLETTEEIDHGSTSESSAETTVPEEPTTEIPLVLSANTNNKTRITIVITRRERANNTFRVDSPMKTRTMLVRIPGLPDIRMIVHSDIDDSEIQNDVD